MLRDLTDRVIIITGGGTGIGAATAVACAHAGMNVVLAGRRNHPISFVADDIEKLGRTALPITCDVTDDREVKNLVKHTFDAFGRIDAVFANAGYGLYCSVTQTTEQDMRDIFETNFYGTLRLIHHALPVIENTVAQQNSNIKPAGHILICSSALSEIPLPMYSAYCATKAAQKSLAGALRAELSDTPIAVTSVHPIATRTDFSNSVIGEVASSREGFDTPDWFMQSADHVAGKIVKCLKKPTPEVWPSVATRFLLATATAWPGFGAWALKRIHKRTKK